MKLRQPLRRNDEEPEKLLDHPVQETDLNDDEEEEQLAGRKQREKNGSYRHGKSDIKLRPYTGDENIEHYFK